MRFFQAMDGRRETVWFEGKLADWAGGEKDAVIGGQWRAGKLLHVVESKGRRGAEETSDVVRVI